MTDSVRVRLHRAIAIAKAKKIKEPSEKIKVYAAKTYRSAKAKKIKEPSEKIKVYAAKHQRKVSLSLSLSLSVNGPLTVTDVFCTACYASSTVFTVKAMQNVPSAL